MKGVPKAFWGKLERDRATGAVAEWHPLAHHCADVAACAEALLDLPTWHRRLARLCGRETLDPVTRQRLSVFAALHDIGKFNLGFQAIGKRELGATAGHVKEGLSALFELPALHPLGEWGEGATGLMATVVCHHGRPYSIANPQNFERALWTSKAELDPKQGVADLVDMRRGWYPQAFDGYADDLPCSAEFEHAYAGLVMLADWLGSDIRFFPFSASLQEDRMRIARAAAKCFVRESWLEVTPARRSDRGNVSALERVTPHAPHPMQSALVALSAHPEGSVTILESETGSGKTEAAIARFVSLLSAGVVDGLYFALPTRTAATQMFDRVRTAIARAFSDPPPVLLAVPGYLRVDDVQGRLLARFNVLWPDDERFRYRAWASENTKRYLAGAVVVGTIDQVLLSSLMVRHAHLRASALLRQLLVVDEVHASDAYMTRILEEVLAHHLLCSPRTMYRMFAAYDKCARAARRRIRRTRYRD